MPFTSSHPRYAVLLGFAAVTVPLLGALRLPWLQALALAVALGAVALWGARVPVWRVVGIAAVAVGAQALFQHFGQGIERPYGFYGVYTYGSGAVEFGGVGVMLALLALIPAFDGRRPAGRRWLYLMASLAALIAAVLSGSRGPLLALIPGVLALLMVGGEPWASRGSRVRMLAMLGFLLWGFVVTTGSDMITLRYAVAGSDVAGALRGPAVVVDATAAAAASASSGGTRLALWQGAWDMFASRPLTGVGRGEFQTALTALAAQGQAPVSLLRYPHAHSDVMQVLATGGVVGVTLLLLVLVAPGLWFARRLWSRAQPARDPMAAAAGLLVAVTMIVCGLTYTMFDRPISALAYGTLVLVFAQLARARIRPATATPDQTPPQGLASGPHYPDAPHLATTGQFWPVGSRQTA